MNRFYITVVFVLFCSILLAQERTGEEMLAEAVVALKAQRGKAYKVRKNVTLFKQLEHLSVYKGYGNDMVVVARDRNHSPVLGITTSGDEDCLPCGFEWWLSAVNEALGEDSGKIYGIPSGLPQSVNPLLSCTWGQGTPYNKMCPDKNQAGCVAVALAQVMYSYKYPEHGEGRSSYMWNGQTVPIDFEQTFYDWDNMLSRYSGSSYSDEQADAVAELILHCGVATNMDYETGNTYTSLTKSALTDYFRYKSDAMFLSRSQYSESVWMSMVYQDLANGCPIIYRGTTNSSSGSNGHAFVIDGYNSDGLVHVNWGWKGSMDGYYDIATLNISFTNDSYQYNQQMCCGIVPRNALSDHIVYLSLKHADNGSVNLQIEQGNSYEYRFEPADGWSLHSVTFNGKDVTNELDANNEYTTPTIRENSSLYVTFEKIGSAIASTTESRMHVNAIEGRIAIRDAEVEEQITVYTTDGRMVASVAADAQGAADIALPDNQTYIVRANTKTVKVRL